MAALTEHLWVPALTWQLATTCNSVLGPSVSSPELCRCRACRRFTHTCSAGKRHPHKYIIKKRSGIMDVSSEKQNSTNPILNQDVKIRVLVPRKISCTWTVPQSGSYTPCLCFLGDGWGSCQLLRPQRCAAASRLRPLVLLRSTEPKRPGCAYL